MEDSRCFEVVAERGTELWVRVEFFLYLGRLIVFDAKNPVIVVPALLAGFLATPVFYIWLGVSLWRGARV